MKKRNNKLAVAIETTGRHLGLAVGTLKPHLYFKNKELQQSEVLFPTLTRLLEKAKATPADVDTVIVNHGPGSFTGVRVGVSAARALGQALHVPVVPVNSLEIMAQLTHDEVQLNNHLIMTYIPALEGEAYFAAYQAKKGSLQEAIKPQWNTNSAFIKEIQKRKRAKTKIFITGTRMHNLKSLLRSFPGVWWDTKDRIPHPRLLLRMGLEKLRQTNNKKTFHYHNVGPLYLQPSWAERKKM